MKRVTIEDVARAAGVSRQTVSRAINNKADISSATRERVLDAVKELGYRPNRLAQGMVTQRTRTIGLMLADIANPFYPELARGVQDAARSSDYNTMLCNTDDDPEKQLVLFRSLLAQGVDGIIAFAYQVDDELMTEFANVFRPIVLINRDFSHPHVSTLMVDNERGAIAAVDLLVKQGHRVIGALTNINPSFSFSRRLKGYMNQMAQHGIEVEPSWVSGGEPSLDGGYAAARQLLHDHSNMTAIFCHNDLMALGAVRAIHDLGLRVPQDVAVIGFDDIQLATMATPALSTVHVDKYEIGRKAAERLFNMIDNPSGDFRPIRLTTSLILRETT